MTPTTDAVLAEVAEVLARQDGQFALSTWSPDGTGPYVQWRRDEACMSGLARTARILCDVAYRHGHCTWMHVMREVVLEAFAEDHPKPLRAALLQVAAVAVRWVEAIDGRGGCAI